MVGPSVRGCRWPRVCVGPGYCGDCVRYQDCAAFSRKRPAIQSPTGKALFDGSGTILELRNVLAQAFVGPPAKSKDGDANTDYGLELRTQAVFLRS